MKSYPNPPNGMFSSEVLTIEPAMERPGLISWLASRSASAIMQESMLTVTKDRCQAQLAKTSMEHLGVLANMEKQLSAATPQAAARYKAIVDAYAVGAVRRITNGDDYD